MAATNPVIDIFLPYWGDPELAWATVVSVLEQDDPRWRLTVLDDAYPDPLLGDRVQAVDDDRVRYVRNPSNVGIIGNFEACRTMATGALLVFLGCDDLLGVDYVRTVLDAHERYPEAVIVQPGVHVVDAAGASVLPLGDRIKSALRPAVNETTLLRGEPLARSLLRGNWLYWPSLAFRTSAVADTPFRTGFPIILDLAFVLDLVLSGAGLVLVPHDCFAYRRHEASLSSVELASGTRFVEDRRFFALAAQLTATRGWTRAARAARVRLTSRLHALALLPAALRQRSWSGSRALLVHAFQIRAER